MKEESEKAGLKCNTQKTRITASSPITSWQIDGETMETLTDFIFLGSKITADGDLSLGRKAMTNLDKLLKSRDIQLRSVQELSHVPLFVTPYTAAPPTPAHRRGWGITDQTGNPGKQTRARMRKGAGSGGGGRSRRMNAAHTSPARRLPARLCVNTN